MATYYGMASREDITLYDATLFLGPRVSKWVGGAGAGEDLSIRAAWGILPAIPKHKRTDHHRMAPCSEVIIRIFVIVATQSAHPTLKN